MEKTPDAGDHCICVRCDIKVWHERGIPCRQTQCPQCGKTMMKEGSYHHQLYLQKKVNDESDK